MKNTGNGIEFEKGQWSFTGNVAKKFDEHVNLSIPLYNEGHDLIVSLSHFFLNQG